MAKNSIFDPTKDGVKADNSGYSSNQIDTLIGESAAAVIDDDAAGDDTVYSSAKIYSLLPEDTATGAEVTITDACPDLPIVELTAEINAVQEGTGDPSPDNVRPISGWDEITITHDNIDVEISLGDNTIYGGTYKSDGTLTVTYGMVDLGSCNWSYQDQYPRFYSNDIDAYVQRPATNSELISTLCEIYKADIANNTASVNFNYIIGISTAGRINLRNTDITSVDVLIESLSGIYLYYPLATPIDLTVGTLAFNTNGEGSTIISCDSGDVTVKYKKLTTLS